MARTEDEVSGIGRFATAIPNAVVHEMTHGEIAYLKETSLGVMTFQGK